MISIIVPVWNAAATLQRCVSSVLAQSYTDWELILSDDGSLDDSLHICQIFADQDVRIRVVANPHRGVAFTRNAALDVARGEYICYVDADDSIDTDYLQTFHAYRDYDMVVSGYWVDVYSQEGVIKNQQKYVQSEGSYDFEHKARMQPLFASGAMHINCNKLLRKSIIDQHHLRYLPYPVNEDFIFMMQYLLHCQNLFVVEKATYHWIRVENQQSGVESVPDNLLQIYNESHQLLRQFFTPDPTIADAIMYYSYELIALKYMRASQQGTLSAAQAADCLKKFRQNDLVQTSFSAHRPKSLGEGFYYWLLRLGFYQVYSKLAL